MNVQRNDGLTGWHEPVDLVVTNPPFHQGAAKHTSPTREMFPQARGVLAEDGELWCVYNAHLRWADGSLQPGQVRQMPHTAGSGTAHANRRD